MIQRNRFGTQMWGYVDVFSKITQAQLSQSYMCLTKCFGKVLSQKGCTRTTTWAQCINCFVEIKLLFNKRFLKICDPGLVCKLKIDCEIWSLEALTESECESGERE